MSERVDVDRLADYVGGALDGTPDAAEVRRLIDTDSGWAAAHEDLAAAMSSVSVELGALGRVDESVPEAVVARLDAVLHDLSLSDGAAGVSRAAEAAPGGPVAAVDGARADGATRGQANAPGRSTDRSGDAARPVAERGGRGPGGSGPGRERRRRTARWAAGLSAAAAVIAFGIGVATTFPTGESNTGGDSAASAPEAMASPAAGAGGTVISGRDYSAGSFSGLSEAAPADAPAPFVSSERSAREGAKANDMSQQPGTLPPELARFRSPAAVEACLDAIRMMFGGVAQVVDLARYEGAPAVVVLLNGASAGGGRPLVVVAGPACGQIPGDADEVFSGPLG
jgi:hypothetical protein